MATDRDSDHPSDVRRTKDDEVLQQLRALIGGCAREGTPAITITVEMAHVLERLSTWGRSCDGYCQRARSILEGAP